MLRAFRANRMVNDMRSRTNYEPFYHASISIMCNYDALYVENSKVACTKIKELLLWLDWWPEHRHRALAIPVHIHNKRFTGFIGASDLEPIRLYEIFRSPRFFKFGFVRNPYDRVLSAYLDKIFAPQNSPEKRSQYAPVAVAIKAWCTGQAKDQINLDQDPVSFEEFVRFIAQQNSYDMDRHWLHQHLTMWHPYLKLDFLGRLENFSNDMVHVLTELGAPDEIRDAVSSKSNASRKDETLTQFYTPNLAGMVFRTFARDFEIYGYDRNSWG